MSLTWLLDTSGFTAKTLCGPSWTSALLAAYALANAWEFVVYQAFPVFVAVFLYSRHLRSVRPAISALILFVLTCGLTHAAELADRVRSLEDSRLKLVTVFIALNTLAMAAWAIVSRLVGP